MRHLAILLALIALLMSTEAIAQGTVHGADGKPVARCATGTTQTTCFGADGRAITRESTTSSGTTTYDAQRGRIITREKRQ